MRRTDRQRDRAFSLALIDRCTHGVMAISTAEGPPYCLPLSFVRVEEDLYFHCAQTGRKLDLLRKAPQVCISFAEEDGPGFVPPTMYTTWFRSAIVTGTAAQVTEEGEKIAALRALCQKLTPDHMDGGAFQQALAQSLAHTDVWRVRMEEISGKEKAR